MWRSKLVEKMVQIRGTCMPAASVKMNCPQEKNMCPSRGLVFLLVVWLNTLFPWCVCPPLSQLGELGKGAGKGGGGGGSIREAGGAMGKKQAAEEEMYFKYVFVSSQRQNVHEINTVHFLTGLQHRGLPWVMHLLKNHGKSGSLKRFWDKWWNLPASVYEMSSWLFV